VCVDGDGVVPMAMHRELAGGGLGGVGGGRRVKGGGRGVRGDTYGHAQGAGGDVGGHHDVVAQVEFESKV